METEMTNELKAKFFSLYIGQTVVGHQTDQCNFRLTEISLTDCEVGLFGDWSGGTHPQQSCNDLIGIDTVWLNLRSLASITDEDVQRCGDIMGLRKDTPGSALENPMDRKSWIIKFFTTNQSWVGPAISLINSYHYLTSKGYFLPFNGIYDEFVKKGWVKLITDK